MIESNQREGLFKGDSQVFQEFVALRCDPLPLVLLASTEGFQGIHSFNTRLKSATQGPNINRLWCKSKPEKMVRDEKEQEGVMRLDSPLKKLEMKRMAVHPNKIKGAGLEKQL